MRYDVDPRVLNRALAKQFKERKIIIPPAWSSFVKSGSHRECPPTDREWFYHRAAAVFRAVATKGPIGTSKLTIRFGGRKNRGVAPDQFREASGNIIRKSLQQLEKAGLVHQVEHAGHKGRTITKKGAELLKETLAKVRTA